MHTQPPTHACMHPPTRTRTHPAPAGWDHSGDPPGSKWERLTSDSAGAAPTWGLKDGVLRQLREEPLPAKLEVQARLAKLYPEVRACHTHVRYTVACCKSVAARLPCFHASLSLEGGPHPAPPRCMLCRLAIVLPWLCVRWQRRVRCGAAAPPSPPARTHTHNPPRRGGGGRGQCAHVGHCGPWPCHRGRCVGRSLVHARQTDAIQTLFEFSL